jgi:dephospho-CoA kinase
MGYPVFYADDEAKKLYYDNDVIRDLKSTISEDLYKGNIPDFGKISEFVFSCRENNKLLSDRLLAHLYPVLLKWIADNPSDINIVEAAVLYESGWDKYVDVVLCVYCDEKIRIERIKKRNINNTANYIDRIKYQLPDEVKREKADYVIDNDGVKPLLPQIVEFLKFVEKWKE